MNQELQTININGFERMAEAIVKSKLFGIQNVDQALALMFLAQAEGLHPATIARDYHIIQGRPALKADAMLARYLQSGGKIEWHTHTDEEVSATFTHPAGGSLLIHWDMLRAKKAGLGGKDMWAKYPRQMLRARVISEGIRATNPAVSSGIYTPEEVNDFDSPPPPKKEEIREWAEAHVAKIAETVPEPQAMASLTPVVAPILQLRQKLLELMNTPGMFSLKKREECVAFLAEDPDEKELLLKIALVESVLQKPPAGRPEAKKSKEEAIAPIFEPIQEEFQQENQAF